MDSLSNSHNNVDESPAEKMQKNHKRVTELRLEILELKRAIENVAINQMPNFNKQSKPDRREVKKSIQLLHEKFERKSLEYSNLFNEISTYVDGHVRKVNKNAQKSETEMTEKDMVMETEKRARRNPANRFCDSNRFK